MSGVPGFDDAVALLAAARGPEDLFGGADPAGSYRRLARALHPDLAPPAAAAAAGAAFARLSQLWAEHTGRAGGSVLVTGRHRYTVGRRVAAGDLADLTRVRGEDGAPALLKVPRQPADSDLVEREAAALTRLAHHGEARHRAYAPRLVESFRHEDAATDARRTVNVLATGTGLVSLAEVAAANPGGVDPRDAAWMWRRLLVAIGWAHRAGVVHGGVLPEHVLIQPADHGLVLVGWCSASTVPGEPVPIMVARHADRYPPEVAARQPAGPATDIYLASDCMLRLMGDRAEPALARFARGCLLARQRMRPQDAWRLLAELDDVLHACFGPRRFRQFAVPTPERTTQGRT